MNAAEAGHPPVQLSPIEKAVEESFEHPADKHIEQSTEQPVDRHKVILQLNRLLESSLFKNSRRYPALLRFIVEEALEGRGEFLKERLIGIHVFDRPPDYDTAADPIVRVTIAEVRKRIAQYYHDEQHDAEIRIELLPGRYAPEFRPRRDSHLAQPEPSIILAPAPPQPAIPDLSPASASQPAAARPAHPHPHRRWYLLASILLILLAACAFYRWLRPSASEQLWAPLLSSTRSILFCLPTDVGKTQAILASNHATGLEVISPANPSGSTFLDHESLGENIVYSDMLATLRIVNILAVQHHEYSVRLTNATTLDDLRHGPAVLIGGLDNQWTVRALNPLRFHFAGSDDQGWYIADEKVPASRQWSLNLRQPYTTVTRDYAIVARLHNDQTGQPQMIVAGIGMSGTAAGGEFVADEKRLAELRHQLGPDFKDHDFEVVLSTDVVNGIAGSPKILAAIPIH